MYAKEDEQRLVDRFCKGDESAFNELVNRHKRGVFAMAMRLCGNRDEADVVTQETFLRLHRYGSSWKGDSTLRTWLWRVAVNQLRSQLKKSKRLQAIKPVQDEHIDMLAKKQSHFQPPSAIAELIDELSLDHREVLALYSGDGFSIKEISEITKVPIGTVKSRLCYAKRHLAKLMLDRGVRP